MRLLYVHNDYGKPSGEEHAADSIADLLESHGHEVLWFRRSSAELAGSLAGKIKASIAGVHNPFAARALARRLDETKPDVVQVQNLFPLLSPSIFKPIKQRGIPVVMRCPNYRLFCPNGLHLVRGRVCEKCLGFGREAWCILRNCEGNLFKSTGYAVRNAWARITRRILDNVDVFIVQTAFQKEKFAGRGIPEAQIGIVPGLAAANAATEGFQPGDLVTFVGRVSPEKGIEDFLGAARLLPEMPFAVAGNTDAMPGIREQSPRNVSWLGFLEADGLEHLYRRSRVVVIPSRWYEGFPNVAVQAMMQARPVVAARIGAMTSVVENERTGLFFGAGDAADLAEKLASLYPDPERCERLGGAGRTKASTHYSADSVYASLAAVYERAFQRHRNRS